MQQLTNPPANDAPEQVNELFETLEHMGVYGLRHPAASGLTWAYYGGRWGGFSVADGTVTLSNNTTNYLVVERSTGTLTSSTSTTNWNNLAQYARVYQVVTASGLVSTKQDHRAGFGGVHGPVPPPAAVSIASASTIAIPLGQRVAVITGTTTITSITATGHSGNSVTLIFASTAGLTDGSNLKLNGNFTGTADDTVTLACDGTNWYECSRSAN